MIYDRIKSSLPPFLSRHVLALEASLAGKGGCLGRQELMDALDAYVAGMSSPPKSLVSGQKGALTVANKASSDKAALKNGNTFTTENKGQGHGTTPKPLISKRCFRCGSFDHHM